MPVAPVEEEKEEESWMKETPEEEIWKKLKLTWVLYLDYQEQMFQQQFQCIRIL